MTGSLGGAGSGIGVVVEQPASTMQIIDSVMGMSFMVLAPLFSFTRIPGLDFEGHGVSASTTARASRAILSEASQSVALARSFGLLR